MLWWLYFLKSHSLLKIHTEKLTDEIIRCLEYASHNMEKRKYLSYGCKKKKDNTVPIIKKC